MSDKQTELPFNRREVNLLIDRADFPGRRRGVIRATLKQIAFFLANKPPGTCGPTLELLADVLGWSKRTIQRALREAETMGVITIEPITGRDGRRASRFTLNRAALGGYGSAADLSWDGRQTVTGQVSDCHVSGDNLTRDTCQAVTAYKEETSFKPELTNTDQEERAPAAINRRLTEIIGWWNRLRSDGLVAAGVQADRPAEAVLKAWRRVQRSSELRGLFADLAPIETAIRESPFVQRAGWFTLETLLGANNRKGESIVRRLLQGSYRDSRKGTMSHVRTDASHVHPDDAGRNW